MRYVLGQVLSEFCTDKFLAPFKTTEKMTIYFYDEVQPQRKCRHFLTRALITREIMCCRDPQCNTYGLLTKCEVKMVGYWPSSFFLRVYGPRRSRGL